MRYYAKLESKPLSVELQSPGTEPVSCTVGLPRQNQNGDPANVGTSERFLRMCGQSTCIIQAPISDASHSQIWTWTPQVFLNFPLAPRRHNCFDHPVTWGLETTSHFAKGLTSATLRVKRNTTHVWHGWTNWRGWMLPFLPASLRRNA